jgi:hypothetical protein
MSQLRHAHNGRAVQKNETHPEQDVFCDWDNNMTHLRRHMLSLADRSPALKECKKTLVLDLLGS